MCKVILRIVDPYIFYYSINFIVCYYRKVRWRLHYFIKETFELNVVHRVSFRDKYACTIVFVAAFTN